MPSSTVAFARRGSAAGHARSCGRGPGLNEVAFISLVIFALAIIVAAVFNIRALLQRAPKTDLNISYETRPN